MSARTVRAVDLFCGAGGTSSGLAAACGDLGAKLDLLAINHWSVAIATHERNLPGVHHICASVESVDPSAVIPSRRLDLLVASPECKHFSTARGGRPINDQKRADPWQVVRWAAELRVDNILIENVPEFRSWGPIGASGRPLKRRRGETYRAYLTAFLNLGYDVDARVLCAADYGDPTTRRRLFILARRGRKVRWPEGTHARPGSLPGLKPWRAAREIIDWSIPGESIFTRKRPLSRNTMNRIIAGLQRFGGPELGPFLVVLKGTDSGAIQRSGRPIALPLGTVCASGTHAALVEALIAKYYGTGVAKPVGEPLDTVTTKDRFGLVTFEQSRDGLALDIRFRMLKPRELARAQGFEDAYEFEGNLADQVCQIGNAVPRELARALCRELLS